MRPLRILPALLLLAACAAPHEVARSAAPPTAGAPRQADICPALRSPGTAAQVPSIPDDGDGVIRVLVFGDFGDDKHPSAQAATAAAMVAYDKDHPFDFGLTVGDNFYPEGLSSPTDPRWQSQWENLYGPLGIRIYAVLGNHDYARPASPGAEMERSDLSSTWCLPAARYTFAAGPLQLFAVDTTPIEEPNREPGGTMEAQRKWLPQALAASRAQWKIVYGHHPVYSNGFHGKPGGGTLAKIKSYLLPLLPEADVYLAGHDHDLQALEPEQGIHFFISGAAGGDLRPIELAVCRLWDAQDTPGFTVLEASPDGQSLSVSFVGRGRAGQPYKVLWGPTQLEKGENSGCVRP